jgi:hypothetical protein
MMKEKESGIFSTFDEKNSLRKSVATVSQSRLED